MCDRRKLRTFLTTLQQAPHRETVGGSDSMKSVMVVAISRNGGPSIQKFEIDLKKNRFPLEIV